MRVATVTTLAIAAMATGAMADVPSVSHNETRVLATESTCQAPEWHVDYPGNNYFSFLAPAHEVCCTECAQLPFCGAYTWTDDEGGTCYIKFSRSKAEWKGARPDGSARVISAEKAYQCDLLTKDVDFVGTDLFNHPATRAESCCPICQNNPNCFGFSWSDYNGGTCWFKGEGIKPVNSSGVYSAFRTRRA